MPPDCLILGQLRRDFIITADGKANSDQLGGNLLHAAAACRLWGAYPGLVARVGDDFPSSWLQDLATRGLDTRGIRVLPVSKDLRRFVAYKEVDKPNRDRPIKYYAQLSLPFPKSLLGYAPPDLALDSKSARSDLTLRREDLPKEYRGAEAAHLCPLDFLSHSLMPAALREMGVSTITMESGKNYLHPKFWDEIPHLVNGLTLFAVREEQLRGLFSERNEDHWEMAETLCSFNCRAVLIRSRTGGFWVYDAENKRRIHLPAFPARRYDITDEGGSLCGGILAGLVQSQDLEYALLVGSAISSLAIEGSGPFYVEESLPGLVESRIQALKAAIRVL